MSVDDWKKFVDMAGLVLLAFTLFLGIASWRIGNMIARRDDAAKLKLEASVLEARSRLASQEERAAVAEKATEDIRRQNIERDGLLAETQKDAADSKATQQRVEIELNRVRERAAIAERALLELQQRVADRSVSANQRAQFISALTQGPSGHVDIFCESSKQEPCKFARDLEAAMIAAHWQTSLSTFISAVTPPRSETILIRVRDVEQAPKHAATLQAALRTIGFEAPGESSATVDASNVELHILSR